MNAAIGLTLTQRPDASFTPRSDEAGPQRPPGRCFRQPRGSRSYLMKTLFSRFVKDESGATAIEYGLIAAGISVLIITAVKLVGNNLNNTFNSVANSVR